MTTQRTPPHSPDAEECVLGAMLLAPQARAAVLERGLEARHFYNPHHGHIFSAVLVLEADGRDADPVTVGDELRRLDLLESVGGIPALLHLEARTPATSNAGHYADIVMREARYRAAITAAMAVTDAGFDGDDAAIGTAGEALLEALDVSGDGRCRRRAFEPESLAAALSGEDGAVAPTILYRTDGRALLYAGCLNTIYSEPGKGKTWVALVAVTAVVQAGGTAVILDWEGNRRTVGRRLAALGMSANEVERVLYVRPGAITPTERSALVELIRRHKPSLVVYDGMAKALAACGFDEDRAPDVLAWLDSAVWPVTAEGAAALVLDHVTKASDSRGRWARGSGAKLGEVDGAAYSLRSSGFSRHQAGDAKLYIAKDREGLVGAESELAALVRFSPTDSGERLEVTVDPRPGAQEGAAGHTDDVEARRVLTFEVLRRSTGPHMVVEVARSVHSTPTPNTSQTEQTRRDLDALVAAGNARVSKGSKGGRGGGVPAGYSAVADVQEVAF